MFTNRPLFHVLDFLTSKLTWRNTKQSIIEEYHLIYAIERILTFYWYSTPNTVQETVLLSFHPIEQLMYAYHAEPEDYEPEKTKETRLKYCAFLDNATISILRYSILAAQQVTLDHFFNDL